MVTLKSLIACMDIGCCPSQIRGGVIECIYSLSIASHFTHSTNSVLGGHSFKIHAEYLATQIPRQLLPPIRASLTIVVTPIHHLHTSVIFRFAAKKKYDTRAVTSH